MDSQQAAIAGARPASAFADVNGLRLHYVDWGAGADRWGHSDPRGFKAPARTILLCHGGSAHCHWWDDVAPQLTEYGRVLALDFRGHGRSQWASSYGLAAYLDDLTKFIENHLSRRVILVGHSMGGVIAMRVTVHTPQLLTLWLLSMRNRRGCRLRLGSSGDGNGANSQGFVPSFQPVRP
jgi:pimeloyl-ACP methyl ester carboxylesterase